MRTPVRVPRLLTTAPGRRSGAVAVFVAIFAAVLIAFVGLAIDTAYVRKVNQELQVAADAAALAGAQMILADSGDTQFTITRQTAIRHGDGQPRGQLGRPARGQRVERDGGRHRRRGLGPP